MLVGLVVATVGVASCYRTEAPGKGLPTPATVPLTGTYPLPSDGWHPGDSSLLALTTGPFEATLTRNGACAWLGTRSGSGMRPFIWPAGYRVRFHPTQLIGPDHQIIANAGQNLDIGGGVDPPNDATGPCTTPGQETWLSQSIPQRA